MSNGRGCFIACVGSTVVEKVGLNRIQTQHFSHPRKASSVNGQRSKFLECPTVLRRRVTFVRSKAVTGVQAIELEHVSIPGGLGNYGCGSDAGGERVPADDSSLRRGAVWNPASVDQDKIRCTS